MTDYLADTPVVIRPECPGCEPDLDPRTYDVRWCPRHQPDRTGSEDVLVAPHDYLTSGGEAGGAPNRAWCDPLHGRA